MTYYKLEKIMSDKEKLNRSWLKKRYGDEYVGVVDKLFKFKQSFVSPDEYDINFLLTRIYMAPRYMVENEGIPSEFRSSLIQLIPYIVVKTMKTKF